MTVKEEQLQEALANCDREPIQTPGTIQTFGALIALDMQFQHIESASQTTETFLGVKAADLLDRPISALLSREEAHRARNSLAHRGITKQREVIGETRIAGYRLQMSLHVKDERSVLEFLPMRDAGMGEAGALEKTRALLAESSAVNDFQSTLDTSVDSLRVSTGYDRVDAYRFMPDGTGEVVSESRAAHTDSFLGMRFPASDIPPIARKLYATTPIRVIADVNAEDSPILTSASNSPPLDLSLALLRGTAGVHLQYLRNMGVKSTLTLPIVVDGRLWGLFAMHHMKPRLPDANMLLATELSGKMLSLIIKQTTETRHRAHLDNCTAIAKEIIATEEDTESIDTYWKIYGPRLVEAIATHGFVHIDGDRVSMSGNTPSAGTCLAVRDLLSESDDNLLPVDDLHARLPSHEFGDTGGALVMQLSKMPRINLILFRDLAMRHINWAGAPEKQITVGATGPELHPRNSFSQYEEHIKERSDEWTSEDMEVATVLKDALVRTLGIETDEKRDSRHRLRLMIRELNHRVRNILTLVQALSASSKTSATNVEEYATALEQRIAALASAHDLLTREDMRGIRLDKIATLELSPYLDRTSEASSLAGPEVLLNADASPIVALVLHELTSNAVKYGALSQAGGSVALSWHISDTSLNIDWREQGGPAVTQPVHEGFGRSIIENAIPYEFGGTAAITFNTAGVHAQFSLPSSEFESTNLSLHNAQEDSETVVELTSLNPGLSSGLIVEDNFVIARQATRWLDELGFEQVVAAASVKSALAHLSDGHFDFCLLDVNLRGEMSEPVAKKLTELNIPFIFASGYGSDGAELCSQFDVPFLTKPISVEVLRDELEAMGLGKW